MVENGDLEYCTGSQPFSLLDDTNGRTEKTLQLIVSEMIELFGSEVRSCES